MSADLLKVSKGLKLVYWGLVVVIIAGVLGFLGGQAAGRIGETPLLVVRGIAEVIGFVGTIIGLVGRYYCLSTPPKARTAKSRITLSFVFAACAAVGSLVSSVGTFAHLPLLPSLLVGGVGSLLGIAGVIFFLLFAKALAEFIRRKQLADDAEGVLMLVYGILGCHVISLGVSVVIITIATGARDAGGFAIAGCFGMLFSLAALVLSIMALIKGARLLTELSDAVCVHAKKVRKKEREEEEEDEDEDEPEEEEDEEDDRPRRKRRKRDEDND